MKKTIISLLTLLIAVAVVGCGKNQSAEEAVGIYRGTGSKMAQLNYEYFVITAEGSLYTLERVGSYTGTTYNRDYKAEIKRMAYQFDGKKFESGDLQGEKVAESPSLPPTILTLLRVNDRAKVLRQHLVANGIELEVRLAQQKVAFSEAQVKHLDVLILNKEKLVGHIKSRGLKQMWISDYTNTDFYEMDDRFNLPAGITRDPGRTLEALN